MLWTLLGLFVPIAIHLWSRREARTLKVGSVSLLEASSTVKSRALRPSEWLLLLFRCLAVGLLALLLASPFIGGKQQNQRLIYVIDPAVVSEVFERIEDNWPEEAEIRLLEAGLPIFEGTLEDLQASNTVMKNKGNGPYYWQLVPELSNLKADSIVVYTRGYAKGLLGRRPASPGRIRWEILPDEAQTNTPLLTLDNQRASQRISIRSTGNATSWIKENLTDGSGEDSLPRIQTEPLSVQLDLPDSLSNERQYLRAALRAGADFLNREVQSDQGPVLYFESDPQSAELLMKDSNRNLRLTRRLNPKNTVEEQLTEQLLQHLVSDSQPAALARNYDRRQVAAELLQGNIVEDETEIKAKAALGLGKPLRPWILGLLFIVLVAERLIAKTRKQ